MIDIFETLGWLNAIDNCSYLNNEARRVINEAAQFSPPDSMVRLILERLRNTAHSSATSREKAEIMLHCAAIGHWRGWYAQAARDARDAVILYTGDNHRHAVALWILGTIQWEMLQNHDAYRNWADAKEIFHQLEAYYQQFQKGKSWYKIPVQRMEANCAARPEEIWTWLNYFERSSLRPPTQQVVDCVQKKIREQAYSNVYALMQDLQEANRRCEEVHEMAEIYLEFGLAAYQLGNNHFAIDLLGNAVQNFYPGIGSYHKEVVARCMLGAVEWLQKSSNSQASGHWLHCIEEFENLRGLADRDCLQEKEQWYAQHRNFLWAALLEQCKQHPKPLNPDSHIHEEDGPQPAPSTPNGRKTNTYHDLLIQVKWDRAIADRLIEFERKKSPAADRNELINRSIERLLRDRI